MSESLVEYFVTIGLGDSLEPINATDDTANPITGVKVHSGKLDPHVGTGGGFHPIQNTVSGNSANLSKGSYFTSDLWICFSRMSNQGPPVTDIRLASSTKLIPPTYKSVQFECNGKLVYLCYGTNPQEPPIVDVQLFSTKNGEKCPDTFLPVEGDVGQLGSLGFVLCLRRGPASPLEITYQAQLLDRYPLEDNPLYPLPQSVPIFCRPDGLTLKKSAEAPTSLNFVLTTGEAVKLYGCVISFYEPVKITKELLKNSERMLSFFRHRRSISEDGEVKSKTRGDLSLEKGVSDELDDSSIHRWTEITQDLSLDSTLYTQKCICLLSYYPYFENFRKYMAELYRLSCSPDVFPIERHLSNLWETPLPRTEQIRSELTIGQVAIAFERPPIDDFPLANFSFEMIFKCLSLNSIIQLFTALLLERKVILTAAHSGLLAPVAEAALALIFPFQWQYSYIPVLPRQISGIVDAPMPIFVGVNAQYTDSHFYTVEDICIFDLETDEVFIHEKNPLPELPQAPLKDLIQELQTEAHVSSIKPFTSVEKELMDFAFDFGDAPSAVRLEKEEKKEQFNVRACRAAFVHFFTEVLGDMQKFMLYPTEANVQGLDDLFDRKAFLASRNTPLTESKKFLKYFLSTQSFMKYVEERTFNSSRGHELDFFDSCCKYELSLKKVTRNSQRAQTLVQSLAHRHFDRETYVVPPPKLDDLESPKRTYKVFPKLEHHLFYSTRAIDVHNMKGLNVENQERISRAFTVTFNTTKPSQRRADTKRLSSMTLNMTARGFVKKEHWAEHLLIAIYGSWFILQANTVEHLKDKEKAINQTMQMLNYARTHRLEPDELTYCHALIVMAKMKQVKTAEAIFEAMKQAGIQPSAITYNAYATALADGNMGTSAESAELSKMLNKASNTVNSNNTEEDFEIFSDEDDHRTNTILETEEESPGMPETFSDQKNMEIDFLNLKMSGIEKCPQCNTPLPDSEIMAGWGDDIHDYTTQCVACQVHRFVPMLRVKYRMMKIAHLPKSPMKTPELKKRGSFYTRKLEEDKQDFSAEDFDLQFPYLNPLVLRKEVENLVRTHRRDLASPRRLRKEHPAVFWNLLWYFAHQEIPLDCILGEDLSENVRITPLAEVKSVPNSSRLSRKVTLWNSNVLTYTLEQIDQAIKSNDLASALRMFMRNRIQSDDQFWQQSMFKFMEESYVSSHTNPTPKMLQEFLSNYRTAFTDLPPDLSKAVTMIDRAPGSSVRAFRNIFGHEEFYRTRELTYVREDMIPSDLEE